MMAGKLRNPATHQQFRKTGTDEHGQPTGDWAPMGTVWCSINPLTTRNFENARQAYAKATHEIRCRYLPSGITINDRLVFRGVSYYVGHIGNNEERNREIVLLVSSDA